MLDSRYEINFSLPVYLSVTRSSDDGFNHKLADRVNMARVTQAGKISPYWAVICPISNPVVPTLNSLIIPNTKWGFPAALGLGILQMAT